MICPKYIAFVRLLLSKKAHLTFRNISQIKVSKCSPCSSIIIIIRKYSLELQPTITACKVMTFVNFQNVMTKLIIWFYTQRFLGKRQNNDCYQRLAYVRQNSKYREYRDITLLFNKCTYIISYAMMLFILIGEALASLQRYKDCRCHETVSG